MFLSASAPYPPAPPKPFFSLAFQELRIKGDSFSIKFRTQFQNLISDSAVVPKPSGGVSPLTSLRVLTWHIRPTHKDPSTRSAP